MRFSDNGIDFPDQLLRARDDGRVVIIAGAGVSMGAAGLPGFDGLTSGVLDALGLSKTSPARRLHDLKARLEGVELDAEDRALLQAPDRVFTLMENEVDRHHIINEVGKRLSVTDETDRTAHTLLRDIATDPEGRIRLVTTNFDHLFETENTPTFLPSSLPDLEHDPMFDGLVYLHGRIGAPLVRNENDDIVISTRDFGRAYLMDGNAARFLRDLIRQNVVLFVGYQANDPPVRYLLEAIQKFETVSPQLYAFASDDTALKTAWREKGVQPISYAVKENDHSKLWEGLELWAERARDPENWMSQVARLGQSKPESLKAYQRSLIAHLVSTAEGAAQFCNQDPAPCADWIRVFDVRERYREARLPIHDDNVPPDPFNLYSLAEDEQPVETKSGEQRRSRIPEGMLDLLETTQSDADAGDLALVSNFRDGFRSGANARLSSRQNILGRWLVSTVESPVLVDWLCRQNALHSELISTLRWQVWRQADDMSSEWRDCWRALIDALTFSRAEEDRMSLRSAKAELTPVCIERLSDLHRPRLGFERYIADRDESDVVHAIKSRLEVNFTDQISTLPFPDELLSRRVQMLWDHLTRAISLLGFVDRQYGFYVPSIRASKDPEVDNFGRSRDLGLLLLSYTKALTLWASRDPDSAKAHAQNWPHNTEFVFGRLWCWAIGEPSLLSKGKASACLTDMSSERFWDQRNRRDLLTSLAKRHTSVSTDAAASIERLLIDGPYADPDEEHRDLYRAWQRLQVAQYLKNAGWVFTADIDSMMEDWRKDAPEWTLESSYSADESLEGRSGSVRSNYDFAPLEGLPLPDIIQTAYDLSGRTESFTETKPWEGLCRDNPQRAFLALRISDRRGDRTDWAWRAFLNTVAEANLPPRFHQVILCALSTKAPEALHEPRYAALRWIESVAPGLMALDIKRFDALLNQLVLVAASKEERDDYDPETDARHSRAINSFPGRLAGQLFKDSRLRDKDAIPIFVETRLDAMLDFEGSALDMVVSIFGEYVGLVHLHLPKIYKRLTELVFESGSEQLSAAFWSGYNFLAYTINVETFRALKPHLLARVKFCRDIGQIERETGTILNMWLVISGGSDPEITDDEIRDLLLNGTDAFRRKVIRTLWRWSQHPQTGDAVLKETSRLLTDIWPLQRSIRSENLSQQMIDLALESTAHFDALAGPVLDRIEMGRRVGSESFPGVSEASQALMQERGPAVLSWVETIMDGQPPEHSYHLSRYLEQVEKLNASVSDLPAFGRLKALLPPGT